MANFTDSISKYYEDVVAEMKKVTWPSQAELREATLVVLTVAGVLALFTFGVDYIINTFVKAVFRP
ncbi:MAG: preprotein translocase subunit SecE [Rhizobacter sp.]|nr:preprotein translocase subunit SecE [Chlorobiales bacterium]